MEDRPITPGFVADALSCLPLAGIAPAPFLARLGLPEDGASPLSTTEYGRLWTEIARVTGDEFFGLAARPMRPGSFALLCHASLGSETLAPALRRAIAFLAVVLDDPRGELTIRDGLAVIELTTAEPRSAFAYRTYWLILMGVACWLIGRRIPLRQVSFACPAPPRREDYQSFFGAPVLFGQPVTSLSFEATWLRLPVNRDEAALQRFLRGAPGNILVRYREDGGMAARVRHLLASQAPADWPDFPELARSFGMSTATLRRRLHAEGQSFAALKDARRATLARQFLQEARLSVADIATELGYSEPSAFYRAFRKWTGGSPAASRP